MSELPVRLVPITGGYILHYGDCDCPDAERPGRSRVMAVISAHQAVARLHAERPGGITQPARIIRRDCAANVPMHDPQPLSWQERHGLYMREAARAIHAQADHMMTMCASGGARLTESRFGEDDHLVPFWRPEKDHLRTQVRNAYTTQQLLLCVQGVANPDVEAERLVGQAEEVYRRTVETLLTDVSQYADSLDQAYADLERWAAVQFVGWLRTTLSSIVAHRTLRGAVG
jgi:hypothetical protein